MHDVIIKFEGTFIFDLKEWEIPTLYICYDIYLVIVCFSRTKFTIKLRWWNFKEPFMLILRNSLSFRRTVLYKYNKRNSKEKYSLIMICIT
jgi:hypothetical protein